MDKPPNPEEDYASTTDDEEDLASYKKGGYHPTRIGDVYNDRYTIESKLGWGHFSTVWLASDSRVSDDHPHKLVALKIQKSESHYMEAAMDEIDLLNDARKHANDSEDAERGARFVVQLLDHFLIHGPHGKHACLVFETMGKNTLSLIKKYEYKGIPPYIVKIMARQLLEGISYLHTYCNIIHTDLKPENFLMLPAEPFDLSQLHYYRTRAVREREEQERKAAEVASDPRYGMSPAFDDRSTPLSKSAKKALRQAQAAQAKNQALSDYTIIPAGEPLGRARKDRAPHPWHARRAARQEMLRLMHPVERAVAAYTVKVSDLGNACWTTKHFTEDIATRQYRAPEVIVGLPYDTAVDTWAIACIVFELITGDYLFDPKADPEGRHSRNEDHLALMRELLGAFPKKFLFQGRHSREFFNKKGDFLHIRDLQNWPLCSVLTDKYAMSASEASLIADTLLMPMLRIDPAQRATAAECLKSPWLRLTPSDISCVYRDYGLLDQMDPSVALEALLTERVRAEEVLRWVTETRFSESRLERHMRKHCPYMAWLRDSRPDVDIDAEIERLRAEVAEPTQSSRRVMTLDEMNSVVEQACAERVQAMVEAQAAAADAQGAEGNAEDTVHEGQEEDAEKPSENTIDTESESKVDETDGVVEDTQETDAVSGSPDEETATDDANTVVEALESQLEGMTITEDST